MEVCIKCHKNVSSGLLKNCVCVFCEATPQDTVENLKARILELELELQRQKAPKGESDKVVRVIWGDHFNTESLH